ncbi:hypothetical protein BIW11_00196 [Tropilaelaps mercedesae]|uniref:Secreted salivary gland peptide-like n=1 Tax=Tropilaelaps mercedesae TaxID=418985 RepID=A0A1V9Y0B9_9ACAR|nr:hypothetical protein BIW11_00196 [Tropilaelaps mercedesae]
MQYYVVICVLFAAVVGIQADRCHLRELDLCVASGAGNNKISTTEAEVDKQCGVMQEVSECFGNYTQSCATPIQRELVGLVSEGAREVQKKFCTRGDKLRTEYLKHASCLAKAQPQGRKCLNDVQTGLEKIEEAKFQDRVSTACCVYARYAQCSTQVVEGTCGKAAVEYGHLLIRLATSNLLDVVCQNFLNNPVCDTLLPPPGTKAKGNSKSVVSRLFNAYVSS